MNSLAVYVLDTHALVWFLKRDQPIGTKALKILLNRRSCLVAPIYLFEEIRLKSLNNSSVLRRDRIGLPPATVLRVVAASHNIKVFPRSPAVVVEEERLRRAVRLKKVRLDDQDLPICATAIAIQTAFTGSAHVQIISKDARIRAWGRIPTLWG